MALLTAFFAALVEAQPSRFLFDANGNLLSLTTAVTAPPQILGQPQNRMVAQGASAAFSVVVADPRGMAYQWRFNGANIPGGNDSSLLRENVNATHEGAYDVVLTNPSGSVTSAPAMLWIDNDGDGMGDSWELAQFGSLGFTATADTDADGVSNLQEFLDDTDATDPDSARYRLLVIRDGGAVVKSFDQASYTNGELVTLTGIPSPGGEPFHAWLGDLTTRSNPVTLVMTSNMTVFARFTPIDFLWTNTLGGNWEAATNWTPNLVPDMNDNAVINNGATVTLNTSVDCDQVTISGPFSPTLTGSGSLTVRGGLLWTAGTMSGSGRTIVKSNAALTLANTSGVTLSGRTLENDGTVLQTGAGSLALQSGAVITNRPGAVFELQSAGGIVSVSASNRIDNAGIFRKLLSSGTTTIPATVGFNNSGTVEVLGGTLRLAGGGTNTGSFSAAATAVVEWISDTHTFGAGASLNGAGVYRLNGGNVAAAADLSVENLDINSASSTLGGSGGVLIAGGLNWTAGTMSGGGRTIIQPGATANLDAPSQIILANRTLENSGTAVFTGAGTLNIDSGGVITNRPGALFRIENTQGTGLGGAFASGRFDNAGTLRKSGNAGITMIPGGLLLNNTGTVETHSGTLVVTGSFTNAGTVQLLPGTTNRFAGGGAGSGTFSAAATAIVEWTGGTFTLHSGAQLDGDGLYRFNGGNVILAADLTVTNLDLISGASTLSGTGALQVSSSMNWTAGLMSGTGRTVIEPGATLHLAIPNAVGLHNSRTLENGGTVLWSGPGIIQIISAIITNRPGALFAAQSNARFEASGINRFDNAGIFRKSGGVGTTLVRSGMTFNNFGTVEIRSGILRADGGYTSTSNALLHCALGGTIPGTNYGQLQVAGPVTLNGALSVEFINGFSSALNDSFTVLTAGTRNGSFASFYYPSNEVSMQLSNTANSVIVRVTDVLTAIPQPMLLPPEILGSDFKLTWTAVSNTVYRVEFHPDLAPANWQALPGDVLGQSNTASKLDPLTTSNRLYRVRVVP